MAFFYDEKLSSEMLMELSLMDSDKITAKDAVLQNYGSFEALKKQAIQLGNWKAKAVLSMAYKDGIPELYVERDLDKSIRWLKSSIDEGNPLPSAKCKLGRLYDTKGSVFYQREAHEWYHEAAKYGDVQAELRLAESYRGGVEGVVNKDLEEAFKWYRRAAGEDQTVNVDVDIPVEVYLMRGNLRKLGVDSQLKALKCLYDYYMTGDCPEGKPQPLKAIQYLTQAAKLGQPESQTQLGLTYLTGVPGIPKDFENARRWLEKAAQNGSIEASQVLEKFDQQGVIETKEKEPDKLQQESNLQQLFDILKDEVKQDKYHPYLVKNPVIFDESVFAQFPESPTAQRYLKAFKLAKEGLRKFQDGNFVEAVKLLSHSFLHENTIALSFPETKMPGFQSKLRSMILKELKVNGKFFEGLLLLLPLYTEFILHVSFESSKIDLKKTVFLKNLIRLIEKEEPSQLPSGSVYSFEEGHTCWLHELYYFLASHYIIAECFDKGAQACEKAIQCCPSYSQAKAPFGYCLMKISLNQNDSNSKMQQNELEALASHSGYKKELVEKSYLGWESADLLKKAKQMFMEYLDEVPVCDKRYPDCHYFLAYIYMEADRNIQQARKWKAKGEDAEEKRLPFMAPVTCTDIKICLIGLDMVPLPKEAKKCSNKECSNKAVEQLKSCPCKQVSYCGRDCQKKDWKQHKKMCSAKSKKESKVTQ